MKSNEKPILYLILFLIYAFTPLMFLFGAAFDKRMNIDIETIVYVVATLNILIAIVVLYRIFKISDKK